MQEERRQCKRQLAAANVRLYHPSLGSLSARLEDWSPDAVRICAQIPGPNGHDFAEGYFQLETDFMDVIFTMQFVRLHEQGLVLRFVDEGDLPAGDRL